MMTSPESQQLKISEEQIACLLAQFYESVRRDAIIGPIFNSRITEWEHHLKLIQDFWSQLLLGSSRYRGNFFAVHSKLPLDPEHLDRWFSLFCGAADSTLPEAFRIQVKNRADRIISSLRSGLFPFKDAQGMPSRTPPILKKFI